MKTNDTRQQKLKSDLNRIYNLKINKLPESKFHLQLIIFYYFFISKSFRSIYFYRLANSEFFRAKNKLKKLILIISKLFLCVNIPFSAEIGGGLLMGHPEGIVLNPNFIIGKNATILQGVTIGGNIGKKKGNQEVPIIGDNVLIGAGAKVLGPIKIGDNAMIGANAVVVKDVPKDSVVIGIPAKVIKKVEEPFIQIERKNKPKKD